MYHWWYDIITSLLHNKLSGRLLVIVELQAQRKKSKLRIWFLTAQGQLWL